MKRFFCTLVLALSVSVHAEPFVKASPESLEQATKQMNALRKAMSDGIKVLKKGNLASVGAHSGRMNLLVDNGKKQFGNSILEPLGRCFGAGIFAREWWSAQISAAQNGGVEKIPGSVQDAFSQYQMNRDECLKSADPVISAKIEVDSNAELQKKFGGGRECLKSFTIDPITKETVEIPRAAHCKG